LLITKKPLETSGFREIGAGEATRTPDVHLGKVVLYQLSYARRKVPTIGRGFPSSTGIFTPRIVRDLPLANLPLRSLKSILVRKNMTRSGMVPA
jgi:hypothetical protein